MGLLSFRKKSTDEKSPAVDESVDEKPSVDVVGSNLSNDAWLAGVERRDGNVEPAPVQHDRAYDYPNSEDVSAVEEETSADDLQFETAAVQLDQVQNQPVETPLAASPTLGGSPGYPDMGIVYAGLESEGVATFPSEDPENAPLIAAEPPFIHEPLMQQTAPAIDDASVSLTTIEHGPTIEPLTTIEHGPISLTTIDHGPIGPEAVDFLRILGLSAGCSWNDVSRTRSAILAAISKAESPEEQQARAEVNHASASLRLLRVGPLAP